MMQIDFVKMHALGNDFVMIDNKDIDKSLFTLGFIKKICNRKFGVGCDQLIMHERLEKNLYKMSINNPNASDATACGNATRALTYLICDKTNISSIKIKVSNRILDCTFYDQDKITVNMGERSFDKGWMPKKYALVKLADLYQINIKDIICVDVGNPHLVIFKSFISRDECKDIAKNIEHSSMFPDGINIDFVELNAQDLYIKTWERGLSDFSLACGSGACASFAAAVQLGFIAKKSPCKVHFDHGMLLLSFDTNDNIIVTGGARKVFQGKYIA